MGIMCGVSGDSELPIISDDSLGHEWQTGSYSWHRRLCAWRLAHVNIYDRRLWIMRAMFGPCKITLLRTMKKRAMLDPCKLMSDRCKVIRHRSMHSQNLAPHGTIRRKTTTK